MVTPVSYTHLDVYKRQAVYDPDGADSIQDVFQLADEQMYKMKNKIKK